MPDLTGNLDIYETLNPKLLNHNQSSLPLQVVGNFMLESAQRVHFPLCELFLQPICNNQTQDLYLKTTEFIKTTAGHEESPRDAQKLHQEFGKYTFSFWLYPDELMMNPQDVYRGAERALDFFFLNGEKRKKARREVRKQSVRLQKRKQSNGSSQQFMATREDVKNHGRTASRFASMQSKPQPYKIAILAKEEIVTLQPAQGSL